MTIYMSVMMGTERMKKRYTSGCTFSQTVIWMARMFEKDILFNSEDLTITEVESLLYYVNEVLK